jgi:hypothetical protein
MATNFYADRATAYFNGVAAANIKSLKLTIDSAVSVVETMTANKINPGYKQGNKKVSGSFEFAIEDGKPSPDLSFLYGQDVTFVGQFGTAGDRFTIKGFQQNNQDLSGSVGDAGKTVAFTALDAVNENGPGVNSILGF